MEIRPFDYSDEQYEMIRQIHDQVWPDNLLNMENHRRWDEIRPKDRYHKRFIGFVDGTPVGYGAVGEAWWVETPNYYSLNWYTAPKYQRQGYAAQFYAHGLAVVANDGRTISVLESDTREDKPNAMRWLENNRFEQKNRYPRSEIKLDAFDPTAFAEYPKRAGGAGFVIKPLSEVIPNDPNWQRKLYDLEWVFEQDEPTPIPPKQEPFEEYVKGTLENPDFEPKLWFMALDGDRFAGMTCLWPDKMKPHKLHTGWTGVDRPYRKQGLAMAMKVTAMAHAKQMPGVTLIETDNHEKNWMYQINLRLGFRPIPAYLHYEKSFAAVEMEE